MTFSDQKKALQSGVDTDSRKLILDNHNLAYHNDRVRAWEAGEKVAPVSVDMALTRSCGAMCQFCYAMVQEPQERRQEAAPGHPLPLHHNFL